MPVVSLDALSNAPRRIAVAGTSGSGKTTLARRLSLALGLPHIEIDGLFHGPGWTERDSFVADVEAFTQQAAWVTEWQYAAARDLIARRVDLMVWLDLPRRQVMSQVIRRTLRRRWRREALWNGNVEPPLRRIFADPDHIVRWAWVTHRLTGERIAALGHDRPELPIVRLSDHREARELVAHLQSCQRHRGL